MIKVKVNNKHQVSVKSDRIKDGDIAEFIDDMTLIFDALVVTAMEMASAKEIPEIHLLATAASIGAIFDEALQGIKEYVEELKPTSPQKMTEFDIEINLDDLDEIRRQMQDMEEGENDE